ncbi:hypothetical protein AB0D49_37870 [Streptomyces sp. NPDC048290]|uniref:hypothetical protein n=1 Tax=Streptomyces sp. NPDC048290 TaxID=3155811 RepID=UPI00341E5E73
MLLTRAVTYRSATVSAPLCGLIVVTGSGLAVDPRNASGVLGVDLHIDAPTPDPANDRGPAEYESVVRHGQEFTRTRLLSP